MTLLVSLTVLLGCSLYLRMQNKTRTYSYQFPENAKSSLFSEVLQELLAQAGGIYLSLILLISFLDIEIAEKWNIIGIAMDPLAFSSLAVATVQPVFLRLYRMFKGS